jgi:hypothetical protein
LLLQKKDLLKMAAVRAVLVAALCGTSLAFAPIIFGRGATNSQHARNLVVPKMVQASLNKLARYLCCPALLTQTR